jgi:hypothetical protein
MAEPLKNLYNKKLTSTLGNEIVRHYPAFDQRMFDRSVFDDKLERKGTKTANATYHRVPASAVTRKL